MQETYNAAKARQLKLQMELKNLNVTIDKNH